MRHTPQNISQVIETNRRQVMNPQSIPDGSLLAVHRPLNLLKPMTINSWLIRLWTWSYWNHTAVKFSDTAGNALVLDSGASGVLVYTWKEWVKYHYPKQWIVIPPVRKVYNADWEKYILQKYDYASVYLWHPLYRLTGRWYGKQGVAASKRTYCTEVWTHEMRLPDAHKLTTADVVERYKGTIIDYPNKSGNDERSIK